MSAEVYDISRLKNLLSSDHSMTDGGEIMNLSFLCAKRHMKKTQQTSDSQGDSNLGDGVLRENAVTLQVVGGTMSHEVKLRDRHA